MAAGVTKRIVVTGASSGIGAATAEAFAARGGRIVLAARNAAALEHVAERCRAAGGAALVVPTDVTNAAQVEALAARALDFLGGIDLWFSNVGIGVVGKFHEVPLAAHRRVIEANLIGHLHDAYAVLPIFLKQGRGVFVNMISAGGFMATPRAAAYGASKFGLRGLSQSLRGEVSAFPNIHICDVFPTFVDTPAINHAGNYTGGRISVPPGVLDPRKVAQAVVGLADRPRSAVAVGAPVLAMKLGQLIGPNLNAALMNFAMGRYFDRAEPAPITDGNLFAPPADDGQIDGGVRSPARKPVTAIVAAAAVGAAALGGLFLLGRRRRAGEQTN